MSSAKRTPRYVDIVRPYDVGPSGGPTDVIRLRPEPPAAALPPITAAWLRPRAVPVDRRPWKLLLVPPTPGAPTRAYHVARWQARLVLLLSATALLVMTAGVAALVATFRSPDLFGAAETERLRARLTIVEDSLAMARAAFEGSGDAEEISVISGAGAIPMIAERPVVASGPAGNRAAARRVGASRGREGPRLSESSIDDLPVIGAIASGFSRARRHPILRKVRPHLGVDVAAVRGTRISAPAAGQVSFVGRRFGFGLVVEVEHNAGVKTRYAHLASALVKPGERVTKGMGIATVGTSGLATGPHLHYEVMVRGHHVDPLRFKLPQVSDSVSPPAPPAATEPAAMAAPAGSPAPLAPGITVTP